MGLGINTNIPSINNRNTLNKLQSPMESNLQRLSSGKRINSAKDDAAGLAIVQRFAGQILAANQGQRNMSDAISMAQVGEGYATEMQDQIQRARELAIQSSNGTLNESDRAALQAEYQQIQDEIKRNMDSAEFNGTKLLANGKDINMQIGGNEDGSVNFKTHDLESQLADFMNSDIASSDGALASIDVLDNAQSLVGSIRSEYGAMNNRFEAIISNQANKALNLEASNSRINDTDYAQETSNMTRNLILQEAATAMQEQANMSQSHMMKLLGAA